MNYLQSKKFYSAGLAGQQFKLNSPLTTSWKGNKGAKDQFTRPIWQSSFAVRFCSLNTGWLFAAENAHGSYAFSVTKNAI